MRGRTGRSRSRILTAILLPLAVAILLLAGIDDWGRDFTRYDAAITPTSPDPSLRSVTSERSVPDLVDAVRGAASRIRDWEYVGEGRDEDTVLVLFVRTSRVLRVADDVSVRIQDSGGRRLVTAEFRSRWHVADLGRGPRTLRRFREELAAVLRGAAPPAATRERR